MSPIQENSFDGELLLHAHGIDSLRRQEMIKLHQIIKTSSSGIRKRKKQREETERKKQKRKTEKKKTENKRK